MRRKKLLLFSLILLCLSSPAHAQLWSGIIDPSRAIDWAANKPGVVGGIPNRTTICSTIAPYTGDASTINNAIASCPSGQAVFLQAGTFNLSTGILFNGKSNVTLRGAGADKTKVFLSGTASCFLSPAATVTMCSGEQNDGTAPKHTANWTAGYTKGTTVITLGSTTGLVVGNHLMLDQADDASDGWPLTGDMYVCTSTGACTGEGGNYYARSGRVQTQVVTVQAISGSNVTISPGVALPNFRSSQSPGAWWGNTTLQSVGVENMTLDYTAANAPGISIQNCLNCWIKGVRGIRNTTASGSFFHVRFFVSGHATLRDSYFFGPTTSANVNYGLFPVLVSNILIENNILQTIPSPYVQDDPDTGSVVAYNYFDNGFYAPAFTLHGAASAMVLYEGNNGSAWNGDDIHGTHHFSTLFRNHFDGHDSNANAAIRGQSHTRFVNAVGNVLGAARFTAYELDLSNNTNTIYVLGDNGGYASVATDLRVAATLMRWGNYDTVTGAVRWNAAEVPSVLTNFANPVPVNNILPSSFYLSAKPSWWSTPWGTPPWPAIGPDVTGGNVAGYAGHAYKIPARLCYENSAIDPAYGGNNVRLFNPSSCYGNTPPPNPPTNLRVQ